MQQANHHYRPSILKPLPSRPAVPLCDTHCLHLSNSIGHFLFLFGRAPIVELRNSLEKLVRHLYAAARRGISESDDIEPSNGRFREGLNCCQPVRIHSGHSSNCPLQIVYSLYSHDHLNTIRFFGRLSPWKRLTAWTESFKEERTKLKDGKHAICNLK